MRNWFDIAVPHADIRKGDFDEAVFAAKLGDVVAGQAPEDYNDAFAFYKKTYLTDGLENLLRRVSEKLGEGKGPGVVELQTPFGGGKTHALILVYHYLKSGGRVESMLPDGVELIEPNVATIVGTDINPSEGFRDGEAVRRTLWGEIAYQLGGMDGYRKLEKNDEDRISPGKNDLRDLLEPLQPFILLIDEVLEYIVRARGIEIADSTLASQTLAFFQELTEAVSSLPRGLMVVTLPASDIEDFGDADQRNLAQLEKVFGRVEAIYTPVKGEEVYSIIRRRLFEPVSDKAAVQDIVDGYVKVYQGHKEDLPPKAREGEYRHKMELAYPFHPEVIDILYEKWSTFSSFQRTRGVLRLLANVVEELYQSEKNLDVILPGDINLDRPAIRQEFLRHIGSVYEGVVGSDIAGVDAKSQVLDRANKGWKHLAERNATAVFMHSFRADRSNRGVTMPYIKLAVLRTETIPSMVTEVLQRQANELWYLNQQGEQYYFSDVPNLNRMVIDKKGVVQPSAVREELERRIKRELGSALRCFLWPRSSDEVPDNHDLKLAVLDPDEPYSPEVLEGWLNKRGSGFRVYKNTLFFALPDRDRHARFVDAIKEYLALQEIQEEIRADDRPGMVEKRSEVKRRIGNFEDDAPLKVREMYREAAVPRGSGTVEMIDLGQPAIGKENLDSWYRKELSDQTKGKILVRPPSERLLQAKFLSNGDVVPLVSVREQFLKDPGLPALAADTVLAEAVAGGVRSGSFAYAHGTPEEINPQSVQFEETLPHGSIGFTEDELLVSAERAKALLEEIKPEAQPPVPPPDGGGGGGERRGGDGDGGGGGVPPKPPEAPTDEKVHRVAFKASGIPSSQLYALSTGVFKPLTREAGEFTFTIEIDVSSADGISKKAIEQQVMETLQQIGATVEEK